MTKYKRVYLPEIVGRGYRTFWKFRGRYRVVKGSRASKKSKTCALWYIYHLMKLKGSNLLVCRKVYRTLKDSCFTDLKWACRRLGVMSLWEFKESPLEATYLPTGQKIYFRGLDDPLKIASISVEVGVLCWEWIEEAYELLSEEDFDMLDESIRGAIDTETYPGLFKQITVSFNPWNERHWLKHRFFDEIVGTDEEGEPIYEPRRGQISADGQILAITTNYLCNEWLDKADLAVFERMRQRNPRRYRVAGLGEWGVVEGLVFENWTERRFGYDEIKDLKLKCGLDFGFTNDPTAFVACYLDKVHKRIYVYDEIYKTRLSNKAIHAEIEALGYEYSLITADCAAPKDIDELRATYKLNVRGCRKGRDSILNGIQWIQDYDIIIHPRCVNFLTEISCYSWEKDKFGKKLNVPMDDFNHLMDALRYALESEISTIGSARVRDKHALGFR